MSIVITLCLVVPNNKVCKMLTRNVFFYEIYMIMLNDTVTNNFTE